MTNARVGEFGATKGPRLAPAFRRAARLGAFLCLCLWQWHAGIVSAGVVIQRPTPRHIVQQSAAGLGELVISGSFSGPADYIEARAVVMPGASNSGTTTDWQMIAEFPSGGAFSGALSGISAGGWYRLEVRSVSAAIPATVASVEKVGVGEIFVTAGQSNAANAGLPAYTPISDRVSACKWFSMIWRHGHDPMPIANGTGGSPWSRLGDMLVEHYDVPVGFLCVAQGGTRTGQWAPGSRWYEERLKPAVGSFPPMGFRAVLWHQGESDSAYQASASAYAERLGRIIKQSRIDAGWEVPWYVAEASFYPPTKLVHEEPVAAGQRMVVHNDPLVFLGPTTDGFHLEDADGGKLVDNVHFNEAGLSSHAAQWFSVLIGSATASIRNGNFEENHDLAVTGLDFLSDGGFHLVDSVSDIDSPAVLGWRILSADGTAAANGLNGILNPASGTYDTADDSLEEGVLPGMDGRHVAVLDGGSPGNYFLHTTRARLETDSVYTLSVSIGVRHDPSNFGGARLELLVEGRPVAGADFDLETLEALSGGAARGQFTEVSVSCSTGHAVDPGQSLAVRIAKLMGSSSVLDFDNVRLTRQTSGYLEFQRSHWGEDPSESAGRGEDPDGDGLTNGVEYHLGTNPREADAFPGGVYVDESGVSWTRYQVPRDANVSECDLELEFSFDHVEWFAAATSADRTVISSKSPEWWRLDLRRDLYPTTHIRLADSFIGAGSNPNGELQPVGYAAYQVEHWGRTGLLDARWTADFDGDALANGIEYFLGSDPRVPNLLPRPVRIDGPPLRWMRFEAPRNPGATDPGFQLEYSFDLAEWFPAATSVDGWILNLKSTESWAMDIQVERYSRCYFRLSDSGSSGTGAGSYSAYQIEYWSSTFTPEAHRAEDPDGDGLSNGLEYFMGLDPRQPDSIPVPAPRIERDPDWMRFEFQLDPAVTDAGFQLEYSPDLANWHPARTSDAGDMISTREQARWRLDVSTTAYSSIWIRLSASQVESLAN